MKMKKHGIALSALACAGMLSCGVLVAKAACIDGGDHFCHRDESGIIYTGRYEGVSEGHYEILKVPYICIREGCDYDEMKNEAGDLENHEFTAYMGDPTGYWLEECDYCYYQIEHWP